MWIVLVLFAIAFGVEEAIIVLYLRRLPSPGEANVAVGFIQTVVHLETAREVCTIVVLVSVVWLASTRPDMRLRYFLAAFGMWDIAYYAALWLLSGSPQLTTTDVLFLIPVPWVAPVWAAMSFAVALTLLGFFGIAKGRAPVLIAGLVIGWLSFVYGSLDQEYVEHGARTFALPASGYPLWLFIPSIVLVAAALPLPRLKGLVGR